MELPVLKTTEALEEGDKFTIDGFHICKTGRWQINCRKGRETLLVCKKVVSSGGIIPAICEHGKEQA